MLYMSNASGSNQLQREIARTASYLPTEICADMASSSLRRPLAAVLPTVAKEDMSNRVSSRADRTCLACRLSIQNRVSRVYAALYAASALKANRSLSLRRSHTDPHCCVTFQILLLAATWLRTRCTWCGGEARSSTFEKIWAFIQWLACQSPGGMWLPIG